VLGLVTTASKEYSRNYYKERYERRMQLYRDFLGGKCVRCGAVDRLEFDHIDPATKRWDVTDHWSSSLGLVLSELVKCQLLCRPCHNEKTHANEGHGQGMTGKRACYCSLCKPLKQAYTKAYRARRRLD
jgi:5-methylcytosine-specific restriction endonuclease McrA